VEASGEPTLLLRVGGDCGSPWRRYELCDLAAAPGEPPVAAVEAGGPGPTVEVGAVVVAGPAAAGPRLLDEVADAVTATGARRLVAAAEAGDAARQALLRRSGFRPAPGPPGDARRWFARDL